MCHCMAPAQGCQAGREAGDGPRSSPSTFILCPTPGTLSPRHPPPRQCRMLSRNGGDGGRGGGVGVQEAKHGVRSRPLWQGAMEAKRGPWSWAHSSRPRAGGQSSPEQG